MAEGGQSQVTEILTLPRKTKRKVRKKQKRKLFRQQNALQEIEEEEARLNDPEEQARIMLKEQEEAALLEKQRREHEEWEKAWLEAAARRKAEEEEQNRIIEESRNNELREDGEDDDVEYVEDGPAEIIWQGNEIIVRKRKVKITEDKTNQLTGTEVDDRPTSNPFPPQSEAVAAYNHITSDQLLEVFSQQTPKFGTEQDKAHCPFHLKTGACRFGSCCSRVHFYPDKSCTLLIKNMYSGPGLVWEQDEGLEHTDEEVDRGYEEFYEDVHTEFLKYGEIVNFKVCRNGSSHLRGNVYVHYKFLDSAIFAYNSTNGRYFAGKQISCEYVGVSRWKIAICGEYMKSRSKTCSRGSTCNFLHCFRNPGEDYEWADWDNPPPKYWMRKMASLFGPSDEMQYNMHEDAEHHFIEKSTRDGKAHNRRSYSRGSSYLGREHGKSSYNQVHSQKDRKRASHSSKKSHSRVGNPPEDCKQYDRRNHDNHYSRSEKRHRKSDSSEESFGEGRRRTGYSSTRSHNLHEEDELDDVRNSGDHHSTRKKEWRGRVSDEELCEGGERGRSCTSKGSQSRVPSSSEDSRLCDIPDFDVPNSNRTSNRKGRIPCYDTSRNHICWNHEEEARDSLDRRDGGYDSDSGQEPNGREQKYRHRSSRRPSNSSHYVALCEMHDESGCEICISGNECSLKKKSLYNQYYNNEKSEREEPSSKYKEYLDGTAYTERHRQNDMSEEEHKEHYPSCRSSRSRKKRYATYEKDEVGITKDEALSMDDDKDHVSQGRNVNNVFDDRHLDSQSNSEHRTDRKRRRDGSKPTRSKDGSY